MKKIFFAFIFSLIMLNLNFAIAQTVDCNDITGLTTVDCTPTGGKCQLCSNKPDSPVVIKCKEICTATTTWIGATCDEDGHITCPSGKGPKCPGYYADVLETCALCEKDTRKTFCCYTFKDGHTKCDGPSAVGCVEGDGNVKACSYGIHP